MIETRRLLIGGIVQGVGFRHAMTAQARLLGVTGWVRNRRDGRVEAVIAGDAEQVGAMLAWSRNGPAGAVVGSLAIEAASGAFDSFQLRPTA